VKEQVDLNKPNLLIANDNYFVLSIIQTAMEDEFNVDIAENGLVAYELVKAKGRAYYKAIILDIHMPIMDGIEACNQIYQFIMGDCLIANMKVQKKDPNILAVDSPSNHVQAKRRMSI
jgi:CheY-like chemotaxis protein